MKKLVFNSFLGILILVFFALTNVIAQTTTSVEKFTVKLRNDVFVEMGATVISKTGSPKGKNSILALNGTSQTGKALIPLAESVIASDANVSRMILLDYPGHGNSGMPFGSTTKLGDLTMNDYVTALLESLEKLEDRNLKSNALLGHSLGAQVIQMAQNRLLSQGDDLRDEFGIKSAIFIAPDIASPLQWAAIDAGAADPLAAAFIVNDPTFGSIFNLLTLPGGPETWVGLFYGNLSGAVPPGTPTPTQVVANGFASLESGTMAKELIGLPDTPGGPRKPRPAINNNLFTSSTGTVAGVITLEQDGLYVFPNEHRAVYRYVTGDLSDSLFFTFFGSDKVHNIHTINPGIYNNVIKTVLSAGHDDDDDDDNDDE